VVRGLILMQVTTRASSDVHKRAWLRPIIAKQAGIPSEITSGARNAAPRRPPSSRDATSYLQTNAWTIPTLVGTPIVMGLARVC